MIKMRRSVDRCSPRLAAILCLLGYLVAPGYALTAAPGPGMIQHLQEQFGLNERQVRGALGALLVFVHDRLPAPDFQDFARSIPNAERIMQEVELQGVVTGPLDDLDEFEATLSSVGIGQPLASQFAPAVVEYLGANGFEREQSMLLRVLR